MKKIIVILILLGLAVSAGDLAAEPLAQETIKVRIVVPVLQRLDVVEPITVDRELWAEAVPGEPLIVEDAGKTRIVSNADWVLQVHNGVHTDSEVFLRQSGELRWHSVNGETTTFNGDSGEREVTWDLKVIPSEGSENGLLLEDLLQISFTLAQE